jgi:alkylated DNA repair dioxygenase AlkB
MAFLNLYRDGSDYLSWHADDSDEMDDSRPIAIVSIGPMQLPNSKKKPFREIWFAKNGTKDNIIQLEL